MLVRKGLNLCVAAQAFVHYACFASIAGGHGRVDAQRAFDYARTLPFAASIINAQNSPRINAQENLSALRARLSP